MDRDFDGRLSFEEFMGELGEKQEGIMNEAFQNQERRPRWRNSSKTWTKTTMGLFRSRFYLFRPSTKSIFISRVVRFLERIVF